MTQANDIIEMATLKRAEHLYRTCLANQPEDTGARIKLAWCLFMQALYRAGQESMLAALVAQPGEDRSSISQRSRFVWEEDADQLIRDCLQHTSTVKQLSRNPKDRNDADRLQHLVKMTGGHHAVEQAREASSKVLGEVLQEIL